MLRVRSSVSDEARQLRVEVFEIHVRILLLFKSQRPTGLEADRSSSASAGMDEEQERLRRAQATPVAAEAFYAATRRCGQAPVLTRS